MSQEERIEKRIEQYEAQKREIEIRINELRNLKMDTICDNRQSHD